MLGVGRCQHACSVVGTQQYRKMENDSANILKGEEPRDIVAARENGERETNAPNQLKAPRAVEERETSVTCQGSTPRAREYGTSTCRRERPLL